MLAYASTEELDVGADGRFLDRQEGGEPAAISSTQWRTESQFGAETSLPVFVGLTSSAHEPLMPECVTRSGLEVAFEFDGGVLVFDSNIGDQFPNQDYRCFARNARPEWVLRYFSNTLARSRSLKAIHVRYIHGRYGAVLGTAPELCRFSLSGRSSVYPM